AHDACMHHVLADRGLSLLRLVVPLLIEDDPEVAAARAQAPSWGGPAEVAAAREAPARQRVGGGALARPPPPARVRAPRREVAAPPGAPLAGWQDKDGPLDQTAIHDAWQAIALRLGLASSGMVRIDRSQTAKPRTFVILPKSEVIVVVPAVVDSPAARFSVL